MMAIYMPTGSRVALRSIRSGMGRGIALPLAVASVGLLVVYFALGVRKTRDATGCTACYGALYGTGHAMREYHRKYGHYPPAVLRKSGSTFDHSWRVQLLEFLDRRVFLSYRFDEPWNSPRNQSLQSMMPSCYACPEDPKARADFRTSYFVVVGERTLFPPGHTRSERDIVGREGEAILLIESMKYRVHWMEPRDIPIEAVTQGDWQDESLPFAAHHRRGAQFLMANMSLGYLRSQNKDVIVQWLQPVSPAPGDKHAK